jgi:hypothetical protein
MREVSRKKPARWGTLVGSKRKLRQILAGETIAEAPDEPLANDLLYGATKISEYTGLTEGQVYHQQQALRLTRLRRA